MSIWADIWQDIWADIWEGAVIPPSSSTKTKVLYNRYIAKPGIYLRKY